MNRRCSKCRAEKPLTEFSGAARYCKTCYNAYRVEKRGNIPGEETITGRKPATIDLPDDFQLPNLDKKTGHIFGKDPGQTAEFLKTSIEQMDNVFAVLVETSVGILREAAKSKQMNKVQNAQKLLLSASSEHKDFLLNISKQIEMLKALRPSETAKQVIFEVNPMPQKVVVIQAPALPEELRA